MRSLNARQRAHLKALAHPLKPILHIGKEGVTANVVRVVEGAFNTRELLKVKVLGAAPQSADQSGAQIAEQIAGAHLVHVIGHTAILYRPHPERPSIKLPEAKPKAVETKEE